VAAGAASRDVFPPPPGTCQVSENAGSNLNVRVLKLRRLARPGAAT